VVDASDGNQKKKVGQSDDEKKYYEEWVDLTGY
jgi:hypothetical protein